MFQRLRLNMQLNVIHQFILCSLKSTFTFCDASLNAVVRIYAPCNSDELARVIVHNGYIITVTPAPRHLYQLKSLIYSEVHLHPLKKNNSMDLIKCLNIKLLI